MDVDYFVKMIEKDLDEILSLELLRDDQFTKKIFKQKPKIKLVFIEMLLDKVKFSQIIGEEH